MSPTLDGWAELDLGPLLPSLRYPTDSTFGADIDLGKTNLGSYEELVQRYAFLAASPRGRSARSRARSPRWRSPRSPPARSPAWSVRACGSSSAPAAAEEIAAHPWSSAATGLSAALAVTLVAALATRPWDQSARGFGDTAWQPLTEALPDVRIPEEAAPLEVDAGLLTQGTKRLVESALSSYRTSSDFYGRAAEEARDARRRAPSPGGGRDGGAAGLRPARQHRHGPGGAGGRRRRPGASMLLVGGDDTSTGSEWEAFSLESLDAAFADYEHRFYVAGNHDHGDFVTDQAADLGLHHPQRRGRRGAGRDPPARRRRPPQQRAGQLEGRGGPVVLGGRGATRRRRLRCGRGGRAGQHDPGP